MTRWTFQKEPLMSSKLAGACGILVATISLADPILQINSDSLTTFKPTSATAVQDVRPLAVQRGVGIDGTLRAQAGFPWAFAANPFEAPPVTAALDEVSLASGSYGSFEIDLTLPEQVPWVIGRSFNARQETSGSSHRDSDGYQGKNWFQISQPELLFHDADSNGSTREAEDLMYLVYGADRYIEFKRTDDDEDTFRGVNGAAGVIEYESGSPDLWVYYDQIGNRTYFFGDNTSSGRADWQIWKFVDPAGNIAYVGDKSTASTAVTSGYNTDATISKAYDSAGHRYCYTYTTIDSTTRLTQVIAETDGGDGWDACGEDVMVGKVEYNYYQTGDNAEGDNGNLKLATITTPLSESGNEVQMRQYYRYWTGKYNATTNPGHPNTLKLVLGYEGCRGYDWDEDGAIETGSPDPEFYADSDGDLKPYAEVYFKYDSNYRIVSVFFNGECGCSGGADGEHALSYDSNPSFSGTSGYDTAWHSRAVIDPPTGGAWVTQYMDEVGQPLSRVQTDAAPTGSPDTWVTQIVRNSSGQVKEVHTPANVTGYTHNSSGNPDGAITTSSSAGLVWYHERVISGDAAGLRQGLRQQAGSNNLTTTSKYTSWQSYSMRDLVVATGVEVSRPMINAKRAFHTATTSASDTTKYDQTTPSYTWWEASTNTDVLYITLKQVEESAPATSTSKNGSGAATTTNRYFRKDGTAAFTESARGVVNYTAYTDSLMTKMIEDADTDTGTSYPSGEHPNTDFGITSSTAGYHRVTEYSYDAQGRQDEVGMPDGRTPLRWYAKLGDDRMVTFSIPRQDSWYGPAGYSVANHSGKTEDCFVIAVTDNEIAPEDWLTIAASSISPDPVEAFSISVGSLTRARSSRYGPSGTRLSERHVYFDIPTSLDPSVAFEGTHYNAWYISYDDVGRQIRVKDPSGTISRTVHDALGRVTERAVGTDDTGGGGDDMVITERFEYDGGNDGDNSLLTERTSFVEDGTTDQRVTTYTFDYRGRSIVTATPEPPFTVSQFDNLSRLTAVGQYSNSSGLSASTDPTSTSSNRVGLSQIFYDERGQVWKSQQHKIDQSYGSDDDQLLTLNWYDPDGRAIKVDGEQLSKMRHDRLGRTFQYFVLATDDDSDYDDVYDSTNLYVDVAGDIVLEEHQVAHDDDEDTVLVEAVISRDYDDTSTTGPLDTTYDGGDGDPMAFDDADVSGRIQITAQWYDELERPRTTAYYGTNDATKNVADWDYDTITEPTSSSATVPMTKVVYADDGTVQDAYDALERRTRYEYDDAGRLITTIGNYTGGSLANPIRDHDIYTRYDYSDNLQTKIWVDIDGDGEIDANDDQVTEYVYGTAKGTPGSGSPAQSAIGSGHLLREVIYPEQVSMQSAADRTVSYAYNAQGQQVWMKDQEGNVIETDFDDVGRDLHRRVTTLGGDFDGAVRRITISYLDRGLIDKVTQYNNATAGSGSVVDDLRYTYDDWGNIESFIQDVDSDLDAAASGRDSFEVGYTYTKATTGRNTVRRTKKTMPGQTTLSYAYLSSSGRLDDAASRVSRVSISDDPPAPPPQVFMIVASYEYLGASHLVGTELPEPEAQWNHFESATGTNPYPDLDRFNRVASSRWTSVKGTGSRDYYDIDIGYDAASNIEDIIDNVHKDSSGNRNFDVNYVLDDLNRLKQADEGTLTFPSGVPTISNRSRDERWLDSSGDLGLSQTGNWLNRRLDLDGNGNFTGTGELDEENTFNLPNELTDRDIHGDASVVYEPVYDKNGNLTGDDQHYEYEYDAFGRLRTVYETGTADVVAEYTYNGLNFRIGWHSDVTDDGANDEPDGTVDSYDPWFWFCYDDQWRIVATFRDEDDDPKEIFVHHNAGFGGYGGSSYIDSVLLRDRDANTVWFEEADSTREERVYYCQNWRADIVAMLTDSGKLLEWVKYSAYGVPYALPAGDTDSDGDFDATDVSAITGSYEVRKDTELDGDVDFNDIYHASGIASGYQTLGRGVMTSDAIGNRRGYAGYEYDPTFSGAARHLFHVRHRVYDAEIGRWTRRDPLGYSDGMGLYAYVQGLAIVGADPWGLQTCVGTCQTPSPGPASGPGGGGGPPVCASGTCGTPSSPGPKKPGPGPIICAGGTCATPQIGPRTSPTPDVFSCSGTNCQTPSACPPSVIEAPFTDPAMGGLWGWIKKKTVQIAQFIEPAVIYVPFMRTGYSCTKAALDIGPGASVSWYAPYATTASECNAALPGEDATLACRNRILKAAISAQIANGIPVSYMYDVIQVVVAGGVAFFGPPGWIVGGILAAEAGLNGICNVSLAQSITSAAIKAAAAYCVCPPNPSTGAQYR
jgi:RHS repeat-associated protein